MKVSKRWHRAALTAAFALGLGSGLAGSSNAAEEGWEATLKLQLSDEVRCQFERIVSMRQLPAERLDALEGRVRCLDGREFDFSRQKSHQKFELRLCQPVVC